MIEEGGVLSESSSVEGLGLLALRFLERGWATDDRLEGPGVTFRCFGLETPVCDFERSVDDVERVAERS